MSDLAVTFRYHVERTISLSDLFREVHDTLQFGNVSHSIAPASTPGHFEGWSHHRTSICRHVLVRTGYNVCSTSRHGQCCSVKSVPPAELCAGPSADASQQGLQTLTNADKNRRRHVVLLATGRHRTFLSATPSHFEAMAETDSVKKKNNWTALNVGGPAPANISAEAPGVPLSRLSQPHQDGAPLQHQVDGVQAGKRGSENPRQVLTCSCTTDNSCTQTGHLNQPLSAPNDRTHRLLARLTRVRVWLPRTGH